jgi:hypothetical protein
MRVHTKNVFFGKLVVKIRSPQVTFWQHAFCSQKDEPVLSFHARNIAEKTGLFQKLDALILLKLLLHTFTGAQTSSNNRTERQKIRANIFKIILIVL